MKSLAPIVLAFAAIVFVSGCASLPPLPPVAEPIRDAADEEFRQKPFVWAPGMIAAYKIEEYSETRTGDQASSTSKKSTRRMTALDRTASGVVRVRLTQGNLDVADLFVAADGTPADVTILAKVSPDLRSDLGAMVTNAWQHPLTKRYENSTLTRSPTVFELSLGEAFGPLGRFFSGGATKLHVVFAGHRRISGIEVAELRTTMTTAPFTMRITHNNRTFDSSVSGAIGERIDHFALHSGLSVATHETFTFTFDAPRKGAVSRTISSTILDRAASRGI